MKWPAQADRRIRVRLSLGPDTRPVPDVVLIGRLRDGIRTLSLFYQAQEAANDLTFGTAWFKRGSRDLVADLCERSIVWNISTGAIGMRHHHCPNRIRPLFEMFVNHCHHFA